MKVIPQSVEVVHVSHSRPLELIEDTARICYQSHDKAFDGSAERMVKKLIKYEHHAMLEFVDVIGDFVTDRAVTHEIVRHRHCSFAQESQRYVKYDDEEGIRFIKPVGYNPTDPMWQIWHDAMIASESAYTEMLGYGACPQQARKVLPNSTATKIRVKANVREWLHIFKLRTSPAADPQMQALMKDFLDQVREKVPVIFK